MATTDTNAGSMPSPSLTSLISSYGILTSLASYVSTADLYHLALTDKAHHSYILGSPNLFRSLRRHCLCDGRGLRVRQTYSSPYSSRRKAGKLSINPWMDADEEIEVHLYNVKCDEAGALPCRKCGINVCEECRYYPRACPPIGYPNRFPHLNSPYQMENVMCLCPPCDAEQEKQLEGQFLNETCDCDTYKRWVCLRCRREESAFTRDYYDKHTKLEWYPTEGEEHTKTSHDHQFERSLWCTCGATVPQETRFRCTWCKRRHLPESEWGDEFNQPGHRLPFFENDPCYPVWVSDPRTDKYPVPYPPLGRCGERWN